MPQQLLDRPQITRPRIGSRRRPMPQRVSAVVATERRPDEFGQVVRRQVSTSGRGECPPVDREQLGRDINAFRKRSAKSNSGADSCIAVLMIRVLHQLMHCAMGRHNTLNLSVDTS